ncbi:MAG: hypothetical protein ACOCZ5_00555 [bacterium]
MEAIIIKPSDISKNDWLLLGRGLGKTNTTLTLFMECLRQKMLGIDEEIKLKAYMRKINIEGDNL